MSQPPNHSSTRTAFTPIHAILLVVTALIVFGVLAFIITISNGWYNQPSALQLAATTTPAAVVQPVQTATARPGFPTSTRPINPTEGLIQALSPTPQPPPPPASCAPQNTEIRLGTVSEIIDGDTLLVNLDGELISVGYAGITAPGLDSGLPGAFALEKNRELLAGRAVVLVKDVSESDTSGRLLRYVFFTSGSTADRFANYEMVRLGYASVLDSPDRACADVLLAAESAARTDQLGMWAPTPVPTATFMPTVVIDSGLQSPCSCSVRWECTNFRSRGAAQACFNACNDYNSRLDEDHDGLACEELP